MINISFFQILILILILILIFGDFSQLKLKFEKLIRYFKGFNSN